MEKNTFEIVTDSAKVSKKGGNEYGNDINTEHFNYNYNFIEKPIGFPSPSTSALTNLASHSFDGYTGALCYNIPICNLKSYEIELPISLNYWSDGIKVDQIASWVGLGWSLNAGGSISRVMNSFPDEILGYEFEDYDPNDYKDDTINVCGYLNLKSHKNVLIKEYPNYDEYNQHCIAYHSNINNYCNFTDTCDLLDTQPDLFRFKFGNYSGTFMFDQDGNIHFFSEQNLKVEVNIQCVKLFESGLQMKMITGFTFITPNGYKYTFGGEDLEAVEITSISTLNTIANLNYNMALYNSQVHTPNTFVGYGPPSLVGDSELNFNMPVDPLYSSAWHLTRIESPNNDYIEFKYSESDYSTIDNYKEWFYTSRSISDAMPDMLKGEFVDGNGDVIYFYDAILNLWTQLEDDEYIPSWYINKSRFPYVFNFQVSDNITFVRKLERIIAKNGEIIEFEVSQEGRKDLIQNSTGSGAHKLQYIRKYNRENLEKYFMLEHIYMEPEVIDETTLYKFEFPNGIPSFTITEGLNDFQFEAEHRRLLLNKLYEYNSNGEQITPPYQFVYNNRILPRRTSYRQDTWGYFNNNFVGHRLPTVRYTARGEDGFPQNVECTESLQFRHWVNKNAIFPSPRGADLSSDLECTKAGILEEIILPTGGKTTFTFKSKVFGEDIKAGLVLHTKKDIGNINNIETVYDYEDGISLSMINRKHQYQVMIHEYTNSPWHTYPIQYDHYTTTDIVKFYEPKQYGSMTKGSWVAHRKASITNNVGKLEKTYIVPGTKIYAPVYTPGDPVPQTNVYPWPPIIYNDSKKGHVDFVEVFDDEDKITEKTINGYQGLEFYNYQRIYGLLAGEYKVLPDPYNFDFDSITEKRVGLYYVNTDAFAKNTEEVIQYSSEYPGNIDFAQRNKKTNKHIVQTIDGDDFVFKNEESYFNSKGEEVVVKMYYPHNYVPDEIIDQSIIDGLNEKNMINYLLKQDYFVDDFQISGKVSQPGFFEIETYEGTIELILPQKDYIYQNGDYVKENEVISYNRNGFPIEVKPENDNLFSVYYDESGTVPLVIAENVSFVDLSNAVNIFYPATYDDFLESLGDLSTVEAKANWREYNIGLRNRLSNSSVKTFIYNDFKQQISEVNSNNRIYYYQYDAERRLENVLDMDGNILKHIDYHYKDN